MNSSPLDLINYCSWAKKNSGYRESIGDYFYGVILYYRDFYAFSYTIGDALTLYIARFIVMLQVPTTIMGYHWQAMYVYYLDPTKLTKLWNYKDNKDSKS